MIAVLNGAKTIGKSIESALNQTVQDIEIVVVDDGSTDGTSDVVRLYAAKDPRIKLITLEENGGAAAATNIAIDAAQGEWVAILDADDWHEPKRTEALLKAAEQYGADVVADNLKLYDHVTNEIVDQTCHGPKDKVMVLDAETYIRRDNPLRRHSIGYIQPLTKKKFLDDHKIRYDTNHRFGYDFIYVAELLLNRAKLIIVPEAYYVYVHRISPTTRKQSPHSRSQAGHNLIVRGCDEIMQKYGSVMTPREKEALMHRRYIFESRVICDHMLDAIHDKQYFKAAKILIERPFILVLIGCTIGKLVYANLLNIWRKVRKYSEAPAHA